MHADVTDRRRFRRENGSVFIIGTSAMTAMLGFRQQTRRATEAGGVLLGRHLLQAAHVVVDEVTIPMVGDRRWRTGFWRERPAHQGVIDERWVESRGTCQYLGEWHTHPEAVPHPSSVDRCDWLRRLAQDTYETISLFFIIVGTAKLCVWEGTREGTLQQLIEERRQDS